MAGLKIALINGIKPMKGSGDGITEYAYNMYLQLRKKNKVDLIYAIERARKNDALGLIKVNATLRAKVKAVGRQRYDIFHVVNQEVGFAAKDIKSVSKSNKVVTTIHDVSRFYPGLQRGALQGLYNNIVKKSITEAVRYSDFILFDSKQAMDDARMKLRPKACAVVNLGIDKRFLTRIPLRNRHVFSVGYLGSFAYHKNAIMALKAANLMKSSCIEFLVYGAGSEDKSISDYAIAHRLTKVKLPGFADESRKLKIYDNFDLFVFPSLYEGFGLPILEAQARGLPVIIYKKGKIPKEVRKYCFEAEDETHMAQIIEDIKRNGYDSKLRRKSIEYARSFTWENTAKETLKVYKRVLR